MMFCIFFFLGMLQEALWPERDKPSDILATHPDSDAYLNAHDIPVDISEESAAEAVGRERQTRPAVGLGYSSPSVAPSSEAEVTIILTSSNNGKGMD